MKQQAREWLQPWANWRRKRFWLVVAVVAWTLFGFFGAPPLVERALTQTFEKTGRSIDIEDVATNPYVLSLRVNGLEVHDPDKTPVVGFDEIYVNFQLSSLFRWAWTFGEIRLVGMHVEEERFADGNTRLARLEKDLAVDSAPPPPDEERPPRIVIHSLTLEDGSFGVTDQLAGGFQDQFGPVSISANDLRTVPDHAGDNAVSITTPGGGIVSWQGDLQLVPLASSGHLTVTGKGLPAALRYAEYFLPVSIAGEELDMSFDYALETRQGDLNLSVDNLRTRTRGIQVRMDDAEDSFLDLASIEVTAGSARWPEQTAHAESLVIDGLDVDSWLDENGGLNLLEAIPSADEKLDEGATASGDEEWALSLSRIELVNAAIEFEDRTLPRPQSELRPQPQSQPRRVRIENLGLTLREVDNRDGTVIPAELSLQLASGGALSYTGSVVALPELRVDGEATVSGLALPVLQPWLARVARLELGAGTLDLQASVTGSPPTGLKLEGSTSINGLTLQDTSENSRLAALETLGIEQFELDLAVPAIRTSPVALKGAYGRVHIYEDLTTNLDGLAIEEGEEQGVDANDSGTAAEPDDAPVSDLQVVIAGIEVEDGALDFADDSLPLPFSTSIRSLDGNLSTLSTTSAEPSTISLEGQVDEFGEARIEGTLNPWDFTQSADIDMIFRNLKMSNLTPYTVQYAGYAIEEGRLDLDLGYILDQRKLQGTNKVVIRELVLGEKVETPDGTSLPLKLAVALLTDSEGVIDIDLPVSGDLDDPTFKFSGIVWKAIGNLITRIVTSPFRFLGGLVGVDSEDFGTLRFQPGRADVSPPDREQLAKLAEAMNARPVLSLVVTGVYSQEIDRPALQQQAFEARFEAQRAAVLDSEDAEEMDADRAALEALFSNAFPNTPLESVRTEFTSTLAAEEGVEPAGAPVLDESAYLAGLRKRLIEAEEISEAELKALGAARARAAVTALRESSDGTQLAVTISDNVETADDMEGAVELELDVSVREDEANDA